MFGIGDIIAIAGLVLTAVISAWSVWTAHKSLQLANLQNLFGAFDAANKMTFDHPGLLKSVHGLPDEIDDDEARKIVYLSVLMDSLQHHYGQKYSDDYSKMEAELRGKSNFFSRVLSVKENHARWERLKPVYYGEFDKGFLDAVDALIVSAKSKTSA